jgi:two-component system cell cycle response regulator
MNAVVVVEPPPPARILIVDDEADNRELLQIILKWSGFVTQSAASGEDALAKALAEPPDLMLVDIMMPGMDGYQLILRLKQKPETKHIPVIMLSAMNDSANRKRALSTGADAYITKPIDRSELCEQVRGVLGSKRHANASAIAPSLR